MQMDRNLSQFKNIMNNCFNKWGDTSYIDQLRILSKYYTERDFYNFRNVGIKIMDVAKRELGNNGLYFKS